ncbi:hypothetical protein H2200_005205 [Cladophialophora chaetospira]|uniref:Methyltransferase n=1 Tax=Cladophialophora chaetospira TaxID=386627 RepID=A0AA38XBI6_9EURO|nr:hypothetical protein H2200_005205 [Cladophialophora chaetospira]
MATPQSAKNPHYPGPRDLSESQRLKAQSDLVTAAFGALVLCPVDLAIPSLRILDSGTADGLFLTQIRSLLADPESATLVGTDIAPFENNVSKPEYIDWQKQDVNTEWPADWTGTFDFVHQRAVLSNTGTFDRAVQATTRLSRLVKPGGWIQIVDSHMPDEKFDATDPPSLRMFKVIGQFLARFGLNTNASSRLSEILHATNELQNIGSTEANMRIGVGAKDEETRPAGRVWLSGMRRTVGDGLDKLGDSGPMTKNDWELLLDDVQREAETTGFDLKWWAAWGKRRAAE